MMVFLINTFYSHFPNDPRISLYTDSLNIRITLDELAELLS
jgi:hypothetical protein